MDGCAQKIGGCKWGFFAKLFRVAIPLERIFDVFFKAREYLHDCMILLGVRGKTKFWELGRPHSIARTTFCMAQYSEGMKPFQPSQMPLSNPIGAFCLYQVT